VAPGAGEQRRDVWPAIIRVGRCQELSPLVIKRLGLSTEAVPIQHSKARARRFG
jgi:hypothetical protein